MGKTILVDKNIELGKKLLNCLDKQDLNIQAALWLYYSESEEWRLVLSLSLVEEEGSKSVYSRIRSILDEEPELSDISPHDITVLPPNDKLITLLSKAISYEGNDGMEFSGNTINGTYIEKAYIYRMVTSKSQTP